MIDLGVPPHIPETRTERYTSSTQARGALRVQPRLRDEPPFSHFAFPSVPLCIDFCQLHHPATPVASSILPRQMATITYTCQYTPAALPRSNKVHRHESSVYQRCPDNTSTTFFLALTPSPFAPFVAVITPRVFIPRDERAREAEKVLALTP